MSLVPQFQRTIASTCKEALRGYCTKVRPKLQWSPQNHAPTAREGSRHGMDPSERLGPDSRTGAETILAQAPDPKWSLQDLVCGVSDSLWTELSFCPDSSL